MTDKTLKEKVDLIAHKIADAVIKDEPVSKDAIDNFRYLCQYLGQERKIVGQPGEEAQGDDFGAFRDRISAAALTHGPRARDA